MSPRDVCRGFPLVLAFETNSFVFSFSISFSISLKLGKAVTHPGLEGCLVCVCIQWLLVENVSHVSSQGMLAAVTEVGSRDGRAGSRATCELGFLLCSVLDTTPLGVGSVPKVLEKMA